MDTTRLEKTVYSILEFQRIKTSVENKKIQIYQKQDLIKKMQKEIRELNYEITELNNETYNLWGNLGINSAGFVKELSEELKLDEKEKDVLYYQLQSILDYLEGYLNNNKK